MSNRLSLIAVASILAVAVGLHLAGVPMDPHAAAFGAAIAGAGILDVTTIAANPGFPLALANHRFSSSTAGELLHFVEGDLRATVPPEGWDDYVKYWPSAIDVVRQLRTSHVAKQHAAAAAAQLRMNAALGAIPGADPTVIAAVKAAMSAAFGADLTQAAPAPAAATDPLKDPAVQAAIATLRSKGIDVGGAG